MGQESRELVNLKRCSINDRGIFWICCGTCPDDGSKFCHHTDRGNTSQHIWVLFDISQQSRSPSFTARTKILQHLTIKTCARVFELEKKVSPQCQQLSWHM